MIHTVKNKGFRIFIIIVVVIFLSPFACFKASTSITTHCKTETESFDKKIEIKAANIGFFLDVEEINLDMVTQSSVLILGLYSSMTKEIIFEKIIDNEIVKMNVSAKSTIWGLGNIGIRKNNFNAVLREVNLFVDN